MPEVKWADTALLARGKGKFCNVPLLTLDDIEAWLKEHRTWHHKYNDDCRHVFDDLLVQVQAMKGGRT